MRTVLVLPLLLVAQGPSPSTPLPAATDWRNGNAAAVAVITGARTASSGEAVTIAFKGRARTRSFGQPTTGLSTANGNFPLSDDAMILLTTAIEVDRSGRRYGGKVDPDETQEAAGPNGDPAMSAAAAWLKSASGCDKR